LEDDMSERREGPAESRAEMQDSAVEDRAGSPTWPVTAAEPATGPEPPPVGLNWQVVAERLGVRRAVLEHDGAVVLAGEYFPSPGYAFDPMTFRGRFVDVGDLCLRHCYLLSETTLNEFNVHLEIEPDQTRVSHPVVRSSSGPLIGLFTDETLARRAKKDIMQGALGSGLSIEAGPLGVELRVSRPVLPGRTATVVAGNRGAVISVGGRPVQALQGVAGPTATGAGVPESADAPRPGTGVTGDTQIGPA
jgi:hypothetical protein